MEVKIHGQTNLNAVDEEPDHRHFAEQVYNNLPGIIQAGTDKLKGTDKEVFFVGSLAALSCILPGVRAVYDGKTIEPNLYLFLYGGYGSGKGSLSYVKKLVSPVHSYMRQQFTEPANDKEEATAKMLFLPANSSKSGLIELLALNGRGLLFETEADSLSDMLKQDYGNFSDILRSSYHHEGASFFRRQDKEYYEIHEPKLSVLLSGTPDQLKKLVPQVENGLFSRFMYFGLETDTAFKNVFDTSGGNLDKHFYEIGESLRELFKQLYHAKEPVTFKLQSHQEEEFLAYFQELKQNLIDTYGDTLAGSVNRFAIQFFRLTMTFTTLRAYEENELRKVLYCQDIDFQNTLTIFETFIWHALNIFDSLAEQTIQNLAKDKQEFYTTLPEQFTTAAALSKGLELKMYDRTIYRFLKNRQLFEKISHGNYKKRLTT
jgi:hypothetical protein